MIAFVKRIAEYARARRPGFLVIPQNGERLLQSAQYRAIISAIAKEDLLFGLDDDGKPNRQGEIDESLGDLERARRDQIPVLVVEYLDDRAKMAKCRERYGALGFAAYFAPRDLNELRAETRLA